MRRTGRVLRGKLLLPKVGYSVAYFRPKGTYRSGVIVGDNDSDPAIPPTHVRIRDNGDQVERLVNRRNVVTMGSRPDLS